MIAVPKLAIPEDIHGRVAAWWDGKAYAPPVAPAIPERVDEVDDEEQEVAHEIIKPAERPVDARLTALETLWGQGRFNPTNGELLSSIHDLMEMPYPGYRRRIGFINADPAHILSIKGETEIKGRIFDNRHVCVERTAWQFQEHRVSFSDVDRIKFDEELLDQVFSHDAFTYADHKPGLVSRVFKGLKDGGVWYALDFVVNDEAPNLNPAFSNAWSEAQLTTEATIREIAETTGFELPDDPLNVSEVLAAATKASFSEMGKGLTSEATQEMEGVHKLLFLKEISWEADAWRWRMKALEKGLLRAELWRFVKPGELIIELPPMSKDQVKAEKVVAEAGKSAGSFADLMKKS